MVRWYIKKSGLFYSLKPEQSSVKIRLNWDLVILLSRIDSNFVSLGSILKVAAELNRQWIKVLALYLRHSHWYLPFSLLFNHMYARIGPYKPSRSLRSSFFAPTILSWHFPTYHRLMAEKHKELGDAANKLKNGLEKIDDTREKVWLTTQSTEECEFFLFYVLCFHPAKKCSPSTFPTRLCTVPIMKELELPVAQLRKIRIFC